MTTSSPCSRLVLLIAGLLMAPAVAAAQSATLEGRVVDASGRPLPDGDVLLLSSDPTPRQLGRTAADRSGSWRLVGLPAGLHLLQVRRVGFRHHAQAVSVAEGATVTVIVTLEQVPLSLDSLVVSAPAVRISTEETEIRNRLTVRELTLLPTAFDAHELTGLTLGSRPGRIWGGASDQANDYRLDGATIRHPGTGGAAFLPSVSWIESIEVRGLGAGAEQGGFQGGLVDIQTRSGGNSVEGSFRTNYESSRINASNLVPGEIGGELGSRLELDGQIRGPLVPERLHYAVFGHFIGSDERVLSQLDPVPGSPVTPAPRSQEGRGLIKLNWRPGERDNVVVTLAGRFVSAERTGQLGFASTEATDRLRHSTVTAGFNWQRAWAPNSILEFRAGLLAQEDERTGYQGSDTPSVETLVLKDPTMYQNAPLETRSAPTSLDLGLAWTFRGQLWGTTHELKVGGEWVAGGWDYDQLRTAGMSWRPYPKAGLDPVDPGTWRTGGVVNSTWGGEVGIQSSVSNQALYVQESFKLTSWLSVNPGLRMGWWSGTMTSAGTGGKATVSDQGLEPRIGIVLDLDRRGGFVAKAHWGLYHQAMFASLIDRVKGAGAYSNEERWSYGGPGFTDPATRFTDAQRDALAVQGQFTLEEIIELDQEGRLDGYRQPYIEQGLLSLEKTIGSRWKAAASYVRRQNRNMVALVDRNIESNYTIYQDVRILDRFFRPVLLKGEPLVLDRLGISNKDILYWWALVKSGQATGEVLPPGLSAAELNALTYDPDFALTVVPEAERRFDQLQLSLEGRFPTWWVYGGMAFTTLRGNYNVVTGPDDYTNGGPGPWVRYNEQYNFSGNLSNQGVVEAKIHAGGLLAWGFRGGAFVNFTSGDRSTPTLTLSSLLLEAAVPGPTPPGSPVQGSPLRWWYFKGVDGHRMFVAPRGEFRLPALLKLDLHVERSFPTRGAEALVALDLYNALGSSTVTSSETAVNAIIPPFGNAYGTVRGRQPPRTVRLGVGVRF